MSLDRSSGNDDYKLLFESFPGAVSMVDLRGRFRNLNRAFEDLTGYARDELLQLRSARV